MFRNTVLAIVLFVGVTAPAYSDHDDRDAVFWNKERIGRAVGAGVGALLGSKVGRGDGRSAAVALGTIAGYYLGGRFGEDLSNRDRRGISDSTRRALETGERQRFNNPETGVRSSVSVSPVRTSRNDDNDRNALDRRLDHVPGLVTIDDYFFATTRTNVRGGPSKRFEVIDQLRRDERVHVVGRVIDSDWVLVSRNGRGQGFVYGPLLEPQSGSAQAAGQYPPVAANTRSHQPVTEYECREVTQDVENRYGERESVTQTFCRDSTGLWQSDR